MQPVVMLGMEGMVVMVKLVRLTIEVMVAQGGLVAVGPARE